MVWLQATRIYNGTLMTLIERMVADWVLKVFSPQITRMSTDGLACARLFFSTD